MNFAAEIAGLSDIYDNIQRQHFEKQKALYEYNMRPENKPMPYHPKHNPVFPDDPGGTPTGSGLFSMLPSLVATSDVDMGIPNIPVQQTNITPFSLPQEIQDAFAKKQHGIMYDF